MKKETGWLMELKDEVGLGRVWQSRKGRLCQARKHTTGTVQGDKHKPQGSPLVGGSSRQCTVDQVWRKIQTEFILRGAQHAHCGTVSRKHGVKQEVWGKGEIRSVILKNKHDLLIAMNLKIKTWRDKEDSQGTGKGSKRMSYNSEQRTNDKGGLDKKKPSTSLI